MVIFLANPVNMSIIQINTPTIADDKDAADEFYQQLEETLIKNEVKLSPLQLGTYLWKFGCQMFGSPKEVMGNDYSSSFTE